MLRVLLLLLGLTPALTVKLLAFSAGRSCTTPNASSCSHCGFRKARRSTQHTNTLRKPHPPKQAHAEQTAVNALSSLLEPTKLLQISFKSARKPGSRKTKTEARVSQALHAKPRAIQELLAKRECGGDHHAQGPQGSGGLRFRVQVEGLEQSSGESKPRVLGCSIFVGSTYH